MKDAIAKAEFIKLRVEGKSYDFIAQKLHKSKSTLYQWNRKLKKEIDNMEFLLFQSIIEKYKFTKKARIEFLAELLNKALEILKAKDLNKISFKDLIFLIEKCEKCMKDELSHIIYHTGEYTKNFYDSIEDEFKEGSEIIDKLM